MSGCAHLRTQAPHVPFEVAPYPLETTQSANSGDFTLADSCLETIDHRKMSATAVVALELRSFPQAPGPSAQPFESCGQQNPHEPGSNGQLRLPVASSAHLSSTSTSEECVANAPLPKPVTSRSRCFAVIKSTATSNVVALLALLMTILVYVGWTVRNDRLQTCLAFRQVNIYSDQCNATIEAGPPSFFHWKREEQQNLTRPPASLQRRLWITLALGLVITTALGIFSAVWLRPSISVFRPVISSVRSPANMATAYPGYVRQGAHPGAGLLLSTVADDFQKECAGDSDAQNLVLQGHELGSTRPHRRRLRSTSVSSSDAADDAMCLKTRSGHGNNHGNDFEQASLSQFEVDSATSTVKNPADHGDTTEPMPIVRFYSYSPGPQGNHMSASSGAATSPLVCSDCASVCSSCGQKLENDCYTHGKKTIRMGSFKCRACNVIKDIRGARTSETTFCLRCRGERTHGRVEEGYAWKTPSPRTPLEHCDLHGRFPREQDYFHEKVQVRVREAEMKVEVGREQRAKATLRL